MFLFLSVGILLLQSPRVFLLVSTQLKRFSQLSSFTALKCFCSDENMNVQGFILSRFPYELIVSFQVVATHKFSFV